MFRNLRSLPTFYVMGAREILQRCKPTLLCKMDDAALEHQSASVTKMLEVLDDFGYRHLSFDEKVVFQKWRWPCLYRPFKGIAVDEQANDDIVHLGRFREANGLTDQAFNARP